MIMTLSSPMMTPVFGSPSAVKAHRSRPISVKLIVFSPRSPCDAKLLAMILFHYLVDAPENAGAVVIVHFNSDPVAEPHEGVDGDPSRIVSTIRISARQE